MKSTPFTAQETEEADQPAKAEKAEKNSQRNISVMSEDQFYENFKSKEKPN